MKIACQAGTSSTNLVGDLVGFLEFHWYTPNEIVNALSLASVRKYFKVEYIAEPDRAKFIVHVPKQSMEFHESPKGLYYHDFGATA